MLLRGGRSARDFLWRYTGRQSKNLDAHSVVDERNAHVVTTSLNPSLDVADGCLESEVVRCVLQRKVLLDLGYRYLQQKKTQ